MTSKTLEQLRARAKALGLKGYSKLKKAALEHLLKQSESGALKSAVAVSETAVARAPASAPARVPPEPETQSAFEAAPVESAEERIESAKYAVVAPGMTPGAPRPGDLNEDIERLPALRRPQLALLPQKPGVLHACWALPAGFGVPLEHLRLRLCRLEAGSVAVLGEIPLPAARGHWYYHVSTDPDAVERYGVHLGYYDGDRFVSAMEHAIARIPALYASSALDRRWRVSEAQFRAMYLRAGGVAHGARLGWANSFSSR